MLIIILALLAALVFYCLPFWLKILLTIINSLVPDHIPLIDELIMTSGTFAHFFRFIQATQFAENHPVLSKLILTVIVLVILVAVIAAGYMIFTQW